MSKVLSTVLVLLFGSMVALAQSVTKQTLVDDAAKLMADSLIWTQDK